MTLKQGIGPGVFFLKLLKLFANPLASRREPLGNGPSVLPRR